MFGWIRRMWSSTAGVIDDTVRSWVHDLINGLYGFLHNIFGLVGAGWTLFTANLHYAWQHLADFMREVTYAVSFIVHHLLPVINQQLSTKIKTVLQYAENVYRFAVRELSALRNYVDKLIQSALIWVTVHVYDPLLTLFHQAWNWITTRGEILWHYLTHPDDLVSLLWDHLIAKLEAEAWNVAPKLGRFFLSLIRHNLMHFITVLEDILDALL